MSENITNNAGAEAVSPPIPSLDVKVYPQAKRNDKDKLLAFASVTLGGVFAVNGIRLMDSEKGPFVAMPSKPDGKGGYRDICLPITKEMHSALNDAVLNGYKEAVVELNNRGAEVAQKASMRGALKEAAKEAATRPTQTAAKTADKGAR